MDDVIESTLVFFASLHFWWLDRFEEDLRENTSKISQKSTTVNYRFPRLVLTISSHLTVSSLNCSDPTVVSRPTQPQMLNFIRWNTPEQWNIYLTSPPRVGQLLNPYSQLDRFHLHQPVEKATCQCPLFSSPFFNLFLLPLYSTNQHQTWKPEIYF